MPEENTESAAIIQFFGPMEGGIYKDGPVIVHTEEQIAVDGEEVLPARILDIAAQWVELARERGWRLRDATGNEIDFLSFTSSIAAKIAGTED